MHLGEPFPSQKEHPMLREVHPTDQTRVLPIDLLALELEVAFPSDEETPASQQQRESDGRDVLDLHGRNLIGIKFLVLENTIESLRILDVLTDLGQQEDIFIEALPFDL